VYVDMPRPSTADDASASARTLGRTPSSSQPAAAPLAVPNEATTQLPTLIGEVTLKTRSMFRKRSGRPRSEISSRGLTASAAEAIWILRWASSSFPAARATRLRTEEAPPSPPVKK